MKVLHVMASGARGGGADHLLGLLPALQHLGLSCVAAVGTDGPLLADLAARGVAAVPLELMRSRTDGAALARLNAVFAANAPTLVHYHGTRAAFFGAAWRLTHPLAAPLPSVYTAHGLAYRKESALRRWLVFAAAELAACRLASGVISVSRADLDDLRARHFIGRNQGWHIPNAVDTRRFMPGPQAPARQRLGLPENAFIVGTTSRLVPQKAVADLIDAIRLFPQGTLAILGDGPERAALTARAADLGDRVVFLGSRGDVPACLPAFDLFALSSRWEGEPIALLEAMAAGLPCVATRTAGAAEILQDSGAGLLVDLAAPAQLAAAFARLHAASAERAALAAAGQTCVATRTYGVQASRVRAVYEALLS